VCQGCQTQLYHQTASCLKSSSLISSSASDEEDADESGPGEQTEQPVTLQWTRPSCPQSTVAHTYTGGPRGKKDSEASHINDGSSPLSVFLLYFAEFITLLVVETNRYYHDYIGRLDDGPSPEPDVTEAEMFVFLALTIQTGHGVRDKLTDYWATVNHLCIPVYGSMLKRDQYLHILKKGNSSTKSLAYTTLVCPILEYGAACWDLYKEGQIHALGCERN